MVFLVQVISKYDKLNFALRPSQQFFSYVGTGLILWTSTKQG